MKHLKLYESFSNLEKNPLHIFVNGLDSGLDEFLQKNKRIEEIIIKGNIFHGMNADKDLFCIYAPFDELDDVVTYTFNKKNPYILFGLWGSGNRWKEEYYNGMDTKGAFWNLVATDYYRDLYAKFGLDLIKEGDLFKYCSIMVGLKIPDLESRLLRLAEEEGLGEIVLKRIKAAKLLLRK